MLENTSYENILKRMLDRVPNSIDKRQGSIIYDALAPAAAELAQAYIDLQNIENRTYADTAVGEDLTRRAAERNINRTPATKAIRKGIFKGSNNQPFNVSIGNRFTGNNLNYVVKEKIADGEFKLQCEEAGEKGNFYIGKLIPAEYISGLESAMLSDVLIPGENEENDDHLRKRYFHSLQSESFGGNIAGYKEKTNELNGVGGVKVYPVWNGGGTVKLVVIDSEYKKPSNTLIDNIQTSIDPIQNRGQGLGIAPIGHIVTVEGVEDKTVNIETNIIFQKGYTWIDVKQRVENVINEYFLDLRKEWAESESVVVRISQLETRILNVVGVLDIQNTKINGAGQNLILSEVEIPVLGEVTSV
ncbi:baseplate J/gp47 family protein [Tissierella sp. MSJ-40]|uniref:Baseplate J/gp47 family protein n=1 Tax=Tissierella simiarum TaxID=2841534 RepID=A0ABS6E0Q8_9FIRM|nr:baseplate J/gp47 family protein [Tissierella simiarum]MBU5436377.1 baseplate J/gp47 family protein [Tissierella simiarum]